MNYLRAPSNASRRPLFAVPVLALGACTGELPVGQDDTSSGTTAVATTEPADSSDGSATEPTPTTGGTGTGTGTDTDSTGPLITTIDTTTDPTTSGTTLDETTSGSTTTGDDSTSTGEDTDTTDTGVIEWQPPACDLVTGTGAVTFSADQGATLAPMDQKIVPVTYTFGLVALGKPGAMLAGSGAKILASADAGCSWHSIGDVGGGNTPAVVLRAAGDTRAYGFGDNDSVLVRVDDEVITTLKSPAGQDGIVGLGVDPNDPDHLRIGDTTGRLWDSDDAGASWSPSGVPAFADSWGYRAVFDPQDLDHALFGAMSQGALVSHDAGATWDSATGLSPGDANGFNLVVSPADGDVVWLEGLDLEDPNDQTSRHVYRSEDGGLSFAAVVEASEATLYNGNHLFAHPTDPEVLYFVFGANFGNYGTDLYRYDHAADEITLTHNKWHDTVITFLPGDPSFIYLGLSIEPGGG
jgi:hypothetical protein